MVSITTKRSVMTCFSTEDNIYCHQVRIVLAEKGINVDVINIDPENPSEEFLSLNPYQSLPTLIDRDLIVYSSDIISEYLDERFPHPPLFPVYPVARAKTRLMISRIKEDWYSLVDKLEKNIGDIENHKKELVNSLISVNSVFSEQKYFLSEDFSLVDCYILPLLWRLPKYGISLPPKHANAIISYATNLFNRESFQVSLTRTEQSYKSNNKLVKDTVLSD